MPYKATPYFYSGASLTHLLRAQESPQEAYSSSLEGQTTGTALGERGAWVIQECLTSQRQASPWLAAAAQWSSVVCTRTLLLETGGFPRNVERGRGLERKSLRGVGLLATINKRMKKGKGNNNDDLKVGSWLAMPTSKTEGYTRVRTINGNSQMSHGLLWSDTVTCDTRTCRQSSDT